jgi:DNA-binding GntR family transcriptional regulator
LIETAYDEIKRDIVSCQLKPGQWIYESELARDYNAGRGAIRIALNRLAWEQLIEPVPRKGYVVAPVTLKAVEDLLGLRRLIEPPTARAAAGRLTDQQVSRLRELAELTLDLGQPENAIPNFAASSEFHVTIARVAGNQEVANLVRSIFDRGQRMICLCNLIEGDPAIVAWYVESRAGHGGILDALVAGDGEAAERLMMTHVEFARRNLLATLTRSPSLQRINLLEAV